jgi:hypothetical protein
MFASQIDAVEISKPVAARIRLAAARLNRGSGTKNQTAA